MKFLRLLPILVLVGCSSLQGNILESDGYTPVGWTQKLSREVLDDSLDLGMHFMLNNQYGEGNFAYEFNFVDSVYSTDDNQVRQAGALWGLATIHLDNPTEHTERALKKGFDFFLSNTGKSPKGHWYIRYPDTTSGRTGTTALVSLALIDYLRTDLSEEDQKKYKSALDHYLSFLLSLRRDDGQFYKSYRYSDGEGFGDPSPYFDGETLLALARASKYSGYKGLRYIVQDSAEKMYQKHVIEALENDPDSNTTKGFFQWGSMAFYEIATCEIQENVDHFADYAIELSHWMIDVHRTLDRTRNTAYAYEGIVSAFELARRKGDMESADKFARTIDEGMYKLTSWQVGSPIQNDYLDRNATDDPRAVGGVMNHRREPGLRIDVAQHQMHAVILARKFVYKDL